MGSFWRQAEWLPVIKQKILALCQKKLGWVSKGEVVNAILEDPEYSEKILKIRRCKEDTKSNIAKNMINWLDAHLTTFEEDNGKTPDSLLEPIAEIHSLIERKVGVRPYVYRLRNSNSPLKLRYWIFVCREEPPSSHRRSAKQIYEANMRNHFWGINETAKSVQRLKSGDKVVFYLGDSGKSFYGTATLKSKFLDKKISRRKKHSFSGVELANMDLWEQPKPIEPLIQTLQFITNKNDYRQHLRGSVHEISEENYVTIAGMKDEEMMKQKIELEAQSTEREPKLTESHELINSVRTKRQEAFKREIRSTYDFSCAVCGASRFTKDGAPEVEAAHIYPIARNGSNDFRNGISLCRLHHWAFENGLFAIIDDYSITVEKRIRNDDRYTEINAYAKQKIKLPKRHKPHSKFLKAHRKMHGFR